MYVQVTELRCYLYPVVKNTKNDVLYSFIHSFNSRFGAHAYKKIKQYKSVKKETNDKKH